MSIFSNTAGFLQILSGFIYVRSVWNGKTKPSLAGISLYFSSSSLIAYATLKLGGPAFWLATIAAAANFIILLISLQHKQRFSPTAFEIVLLFGVALSLLLGHALASHALLLFLNIFIDGIGSVLIAVKLYYNPKTEDPTAWAISCGAYLFSVLALPGILPLEHSAFSLLNLFLCLSIFILSLKK
jgi:hypothetical protein